jgi:ornithine--oxo-acid transaminase
MRAIPSLAGHYARRPNVIKFPRGFSFKASELTALEKKYLPDIYKPIDLVAEKALGSKVWDIEGKEYTDMIGVYAAASQGYNHPKIIGVLADMILRGEVLATSMAVQNMYLGPWAEKICNLSGMEKVIPKITGAEAVETAMKVSLRWGEEVKGIEQDQSLLVFANKNFHGRTSGIVVVSDNPESSRGFGPAVNKIKVPFNDVEALEKLFEEKGKNIAAFIVEPIQGEGGINVPSDGYLPKVRVLCTKYNILMVADEVQTGLGRTGELFACDNWGVKPDITIFGKAAGAGMIPVSGILTSSKIANVLGYGSEGGTFAGGALQCAAGIAALDVLVDEKLPLRAKHMGNFFRDLLNEDLKEFMGPNGHVKEIRGKGLMNAIEFNGSAKPYCEAMRKKGFICGSAQENNMRLTPPLVISQEELVKFSSSLKEVVMEISKEKFASKIEAERNAQKASALQTERE